MKNRLRFLLLAILTGTGLQGVRSQPIDIRGTAKDAASGQPLPGVVITLMGKGLKDTTDGKGLFHLSNGAPRRAQQTGPLKKLAFSPQRGFAMRMVGNQEVTAEIRNGAGRTVVHGHFNVEPGDWSLRPKNLPKGLYTIHLRTGSQLRALRLPIEDGVKGQGPPEWVFGKLPEADTVLFLARNPATLDSLRAEKPDYLPETVPVESWSQSDLSVLPKKRISQNSP